MHKIKILLSCLLISQVFSACAAGSASPKVSSKKTTRSGYDVVVYGATAAGVTAAVAAAREGASVALVEPTQHIGGMVSSGLGNSDIGEASTVGGISMEFFRRVGKKYGESSPVFKFEPSVALRVFREMLKAEDIDVFKSSPLKNVSKQGSTINSINTTNGKTFKAKQFIDASYEGDLMVAAGISSTYGRESKSKYGESLAGFQVEKIRHEFNVKVPAFDTNNKPLPGINPKPWPKIGTGDKNSMAYNFRPCLTTKEGNKVPIKKPANYNPKHYELLARYLVMNPGIRLSKLMWFFKLPNGKTDINNRGGFSTNFVGASNDYPTASWAQRKKIWQAHKDYTEGFLWFLGNDKRVWKRIRKDMNKWGYCKDEFRDSDNFPPLLYTRAVRRMIGEYILVQKDLQVKRGKKDSVGIGSMPIESHHIQRVITKEGTVINEGGVVEKIPPYEIPYRSLVPKKGQATNFINPVTVSASHIGYSSLRMEPVYMVLGHSAGVAAVQAIKEQKPVQNISIPELQKKLKQQKQVLKVSG